MPSCRSYIRVVVYEYILVLHILDLTVLCLPSSAFYIPDFIYLLFEGKWLKARSGLESTENKKGFGQIRQPCRWNLYSGNLHLSKETRKTLSRVCNWTPNTHKFHSVNLNIDITFGICQIWLHFTVYLSISSLIHAIQ